MPLDRPPEKPTIHGFVPEVPMGSPRPWLRRLLVAVALSTVPVAVIPLAAAPIAHATVMVPIPLEDMVRDAAVIVHARVIRSGSRLSLDGDATPHTVTQLQVIEWLAGDASSTQITIDELGGTFGDRGMTITGTPTFRAGEEVVLFLRSTPDGLRTLGMVQGQFVVQRGVPGTADVVVRDTSEVGLATWEGGPMSVVEGGRESMELQAFLAWIRDAVVQSGRVPGHSDATNPTGGAR